MNRISAKKIRMGRVPGSLASLFLATVCLASNAQHSTANSITTVRIGSDKRVHITYSGGKEFIAPRETDQIDCTSPKIAADKRTAGWLVLKHPDCCVNYPIPLSLVIYRNRNVVERISGEPLIWDWRFLKGGSEVAVAIGPQHGETGVHFELHDVRSGRLLDEWGGHTKESPPAWISGLKQ
jgi:hypothetical protein